jgi:hypothetical protein
MKTVEILFKLWLTKIHFLLEYFVRIEKPHKILPNPFGRTYGLQFSSTCWTRHGRKKQPRRRNHSMNGAVDTVAPSGLDFGLF